MSDCEHGVKDGGPDNCTECLVDAIEEAGARAERRLERIAQAYDKRNPPCPSCESLRSQLAEARQEVGALKVRLANANEGAAVRGAAMEAAEKQTALYRAILAEVRPELECLAAEGENGYRVAVATARRLLADPRWPR